MSDLDRQAPYTIRAFSIRLKDAIAKAAQRDNLTVGDWLERELRWLLDGERQAPSNGVNPGVPRLPAPVSDAVSAAEVEALTRSALALATAPAEAAAHPAVKAAARTVTARLRAARPHFR